MYFVIKTHHAETNQYKWQDKYYILHSTQHNIAHAYGMLHRKFAKENTPKGENTKIAGITLSEYDTAWHLD